FRPLADAKAIYDQVRHSDDFHDIHAWQFTPSSFRLIVNDLHEIGSFGLREQRFVENGGEFVIALSRDGAGPAVSRLALAQQVMAELRVVR
ncbi:hypothetical protein, partial [Aquabacterium sp.]|uniref:hypothetical protein n=1 Tax=Aquabacterium sp. TaxID=1872578 RepID=UPI002C8638EB